MPQMELVPFNNPSNVDVLNAIRGIATNDYQSRVPAATKANVTEAFDAMWTYSPARNQFIDSLVNLIGMQILKYQTWTNPLGKFKRGELVYGESIEEVAVGLLTAKAYNPDAEYLEKMIFGRETNEVQARWHKINRQDMYKLTVNQNLLRRAFMNGSGLSGFVSGLMASLNTSDEWDEYLNTASLFNQAYRNNGFFEIEVPDITGGNSDDQDAKQFLKQVRTYTNKLPFLSRKFNPAHMPISAKVENLELILTPAGQAAIDIDGLAALFHADKADVTARTTIVNDEDIDIPGFQGLLTTREFFIMADQFFDMQQMLNPAGGYTNYFYHHHQLLSVSPFVPQILLTSKGKTTITVIDYRVDALTAFTMNDLIDGDAVTVTNGAATVERGVGYLVKINAITDPAGGPNDSVVLSITGAQSGRTRINQQGILFVGWDEPAGSLTVHAHAEDDATVDDVLTLTVTGALLSGTLGQSIDDAPGAIANKRVPVINGSGKVGDKHTVSNGSWDTKDLSFAYQWTLDGANVGTNNNEFTPTAAGTLGCVVSATRTGFTGASKAAQGVAVTA